MPVYKQVLYSVAAIAVPVAAGYLLRDILDYRIVGFVLLATVSILAVLFELLPVLVASVLSALLWDFLFIPPTFTFSIGSLPDRILLLTYFLVALINGVLTYKIRALQNEAREKEEKANAIRFYNVLLNSLSHELRTPITTIIGASDNLQAEVPLPEETRRLLAKEISVAGMRLNQQVENLLNMSRIESGVIKPKLDWCDIQELIYHAINRIEGAGQRPIHVHVADNLPLFELDFVWMEQVVFNLVNNAVQYTPETAAITIKADCRNERLVLTVADSGKGFPVEEMQKVFDKFYRLQHSKAGGTGLGLSIVKGFVEAHCGKVRVENRQLGGACFTIEIPTRISYLNALKNE